MGEESDISQRIPDDRQSQRRLREGRHIVPRSSEVVGVVVMARQLESEVCRLDELHEPHGEVRPVCLFLEAGIIRRVKAIVVSTDCGSRGPGPCGVAAGRRNIVVLDRVGVKPVEVEPTSVVVVRKRGGICNALEPDIGELEWLEIEGRRDLEIGDLPGLRKDAICWKGTSRRRARHGRRERGREQGPKNCCPHDDGLAGDCW